VLTPRIDPTSGQTSWAQTDIANSHCCPIINPLTFISRL
jgi:hypothetical protein